MVVLTGTQLYSSGFCDECDEATSDFPTVLTLLLFTFSNARDYVAASLKPLCA